MTVSSMCSPVLVNGVTAAARARACGFMVSAQSARLSPATVQSRPTNQRGTRLELATLNLGWWR
jgi:hypothetical protein